MEHNPLEIRPMTADEYSKYMESAVQVYANEKQAAENISMEQALLASQKAYDQLLPMGLQTSNQFLFLACEKSTNAVVGHLWLSKVQEGTKTVMGIHDIEIWPELRGQGYGAFLLKLAEREARQLGCKAIKLHVFGNNHSAIRLYEKSGFEKTNIYMKKFLD